MTIHLNNNNTIEDNLLTAVNSIIVIDTPVVS